MFNVYLYDKKRNAVNELKELKQLYIKTQAEKKKKQNKMISSYKKRIENFILQMSEKPIVRHDEESHRDKFREEDPTKFLGPATIAIRSFKHEKDRIREAIERNSEFTSDSATIQTEFRKRDPSKEIQPQMRFTNKSQLQKQQDRINAIMQASYQTAPGARMHSIDDSVLTKMSKSPQIANKFLSHLPDVNQRTYFRSTENLYLSLPSALVDQKALQRQRNSSQHPKTPEAKVEVVDNNENPDGSPKGGVKNYGFTKNASMLIDEEKEYERKQIEKMHIPEAIDPAEVSRDVLLKCNIIKNKKLTAHNLRKGAGHLSVMSDHTTEDIYKKVYYREMNARTME